MVRSAAPSARRHMVVAVASDGGLGRALSFLLRAEGYEVGLLSSGEALLASALDRADCLVVDQDLPGVTGVDALRLLRRRLQTPAVLLVAEADGSLRDQARRVRAQLIEKPFHGAQLLNAVREALRR